MVAVGEVLPTWVLHLGSHFLWAFRGKMGLWSSWSFWGRKGCFYKTLFGMPCKCRLQSKDLSNPFWLIRMSAGEMGEWDRNIRLWEAQQSTSTCSSRCALGLIMRSKRAWLSQNTFRGASATLWSWAQPMAQTRVQTVGIHQIRTQKCAGILQCVWASRQCSDSSISKKKKYLCPSADLFSLNKPGCCSDEQAAQSLLLCFFLWQEWARLRIYPQEFLK